MSTLTQRVSVPLQTTVVIVGAGPAGLTLAQLLDTHGIDSVVLERSDRTHVESRLRAGVLEQPTVDLLTAIGAGQRLQREGMAHNGFMIRHEGFTHHLDFHALLGKRATVYGQHELVKDLIALREQAGRPVTFEAEVVEIDPSTGTVRYRLGTDDEIAEITGRFVVGADGFHGVGRASIPPRARSEYVRDYPINWLGILAESPPVAPEGMYCPHPRGLSVHSMRGPHRSRQYLQVPAGTALEDWSDEQIWDELSIRSAAHDANPLTTGPIIERSITTLRSYVSTTMQYQRLFLVGDAAHIVPPTGAKGLNLAIGDVSTLSHALGAALTRDDESLLARFTELALPRVMQAQRFSALLTKTLHAPTPSPDAEFDELLRQATLERWITSPAAQAELGEVYLGLPFATPAESATVA